MAYAVGKKALGICDRCGFTYKFLNLNMKYKTKKELVAEFVHLV